MSEFSRDPYNNIIQEGIKGDITFCLLHERFRAALILIYAAMDQMAFLSMPENQQDVTRKDFVSWVDRYIHIPFSDAPTSIELYGARCALLHTYGLKSKLSREGTARLIGHADQMYPGVRYDPGIDPTLVIVSIQSLRDALFAGIDKFMVDVHGNEEDSVKVNRRLHSMNRQSKYEEEDS